MRHLRVERARRAIRATLSGRERAAPEEIERRAKRLREWVPNGDPDALRAAAEASARFERRAAGLARTLGDLDTVTLCGLVRFGSAAELLQPPPPEIVVVAPLGAQRLVPRILRGFLPADRQPALLALEAVSDLESVGRKSVVVVAALPSRAGAIELYASRPSDPSGLVTVVGSLIEQAPELLLGPS